MRLTFGDQLDILAAVLGAQFNGTHFSGAKIADILSVDAAGLSRRRRGLTRLKPEERARLINHFELAQFGLDYRLFDLETEETFSGALREARVGTYGGTAILRLLAELASLQQDPRARLRVITVEGQPRTRGLTMRAAMESGLDTHKIDSAARIEISGYPSMPRAVLQHQIGGSAVLELIAPSLAWCDADAAMPDGTIRIPKTESFTVSPPSGVFRLTALFGPRDISRLFGAGAASVTAGRPVTEIEARQMLDLFEARRHDITMAAHEFLIC